MMTLLIRAASLSIAIFAMLLCVPVTSAAGEGTHPAETNQVIAEGQAATSESNARENAIADGLRNCIMKGVGVYVDSTVIGKNYQVIQNDILLHTSGFATLDEVVSTSVVDGILKVKVKATVSNRPLAEKLKAMGLLREWKVGVYMPEHYVGNPKSIPSPAAETEIIKALLKAGYRVIDENRRKELADDEFVTRAHNGDSAALRKIKKEFDVDIFVTGEAFAEFVDDDIQGGVKFYRTRGRIEAKAYYTDTGELLSMTDDFGDGLDQTENLAAKKCLKDVGRKVASTIIEDILIAPSSTTPYMTVKITNFTKLTAANELEKAIKSISGVTQVKRQRFTNGVLELNVYVKAEYRDDLPVALEECKVGQKLGITVGNCSKTFVQARVTK